MDRYTRITFALLILALAVFRLVRYVQMGTPGASHLCNTKHLAAGNPFI
jgi:hypothetical protein